jgi:hypothetical protein
MLSKIGNGLGVTAAHCPQQVFGLMLQLLEIGTDGKMAAGQDGPP